MRPSDLDDRRPEKIIALVVLLHDDVCQAMAHHFKNMTVLACLSASPDALTLMTVIWHPIKDSLSADGLRRDDDALIRRRAPLYMFQKGFLEFALAVMIPYPNNIKVVGPCAEQKAVRVMDCVAAQAFHHTLQFLEHYHVAAIVFPSRPTNIFQTLNH
jgi:hypothetical protein